MIDSAYENKMLDFGYESKEKKAHKYTKVTYTSPKGNSYTVKEEEAGKFERLHRVDGNWSKQWS